MVPLALDSVIKIRSGALAERLGDEIAILDADSGVYFGLNEVGARIWELLQQPKSPQAVTDALLEEYDVERARCLANVLTLVNSLLKANLVEVVGESGR